MSKKQKIKCDVESCKYQDCGDGMCTLDSIKVGCTCNNDKCTCNDETICQSFSEDKDKIDK